MAPTKTAANAPQHVAQKDDGKKKRRRSRGKRNSVGGESTNGAESTGNGKNGENVTTQQAVAAANKAKSKAKQIVAKKAAAAPAVVDEDVQIDGSSSSSDGDIVIPGRLVKYLRETASSSDSDQELDGYGAFSDDSEFSSDYDDSEPEIEFWALQVPAGGADSMTPSGMHEFGNISVRSAALTGAKKGERAELWMDLLDHHAIGAYSDESADEAEEAFVPPRRQVLLCTLEAGRVDQYPVDVLVSSEADALFYHTGTAGTVHLSGSMTIDVDFADMMYGSDGSDDDLSADEFSGVDSDEDSISTAEVVDKIRRMAQSRLKDGAAVADSDSEISSSDDEVRVESLSSDADEQVPAAAKPAIQTAFGSVSAKSNKPSPKSAKAAAKKPAAKPAAAKAAKPAAAKAAKPAAVKAAKPAAAKATKPAAAKPAAVKASAKPAAAKATKRGAAGAPAAGERPVKRSKDAKK